MTQLVPLYSSIAPTWRHCFAAVVLACNLGTMHASDLLAADNHDVSLIVLQPAYRNSIYATQIDQPITVRIELPAPLRTQVVELRGRLFDRQDRELSSSRQTLAQSTDVHFDGTPLPIGSYRVQVRAMGVGEQELAAANVVIHKLAPSPGSEVRVDEHRNIVINGKPSLQIGWYGAVRLDDPRPDVIALQNLQAANVVIYPDKEPLAKLYREHGIRTIVNLEPSRLLYTFELWKQPGHSVPIEHTKRSAPSDECRELLKKMVELLKDEPGLFGWYIADEPEINDFRADYLEAYYKAIRELDPYHPVFVTNDTLEGIEKIGVRCCDILSPDPYGAKPDYVPSFLAKAQSVMGRGQGLMLTPWHSAHHTHFTAEYGSQPPYTYRVMRGQYLATLAAGGRGFTGYTSDFFLPEPRLRIGLPHLWREVRFLEPFLEHGETIPLTVDQTAVGDVTAASPSEHAMLGWLGKQGASVSLILMNPNATARRCTIKHPALTMSQLAVVSEARQVVIRDGAFADEIPAGEACVYSNHPQAVDGPTVVQIESEILNFDKDSAKPGNLLHASHGVKARASQGTVPWFAQIYYYAINGITDDEGWYVTHAKLPQSIEFALPSAQPIRRVVLYTPNLRDYDLQFRGADGSVQQVEVRGNQQNVAEHVLAEPVATLKLRIIARAVREAVQPSKAMVREVEAYAAADVANATLLQLVPIETPAESFVETDAPKVATPPLWRDDFSAFKQKPRHYEGDADAWVLNPSEFHAQYNAQKKWLSCTALSSAGYASMSRLLPYAKEYRFLQVSVPQIEGEGYQWLSVNLGDPSGKTVACAAVHTIKPGRYCVDTHALSDIFRSPEQRQVLLNIYLMKGIDYALESVSLSAQPTDGLAVTLADGSPLPRKLKAGDELLFRLFLEKPATDAIVEFMRDSWYEPVRINGEPYVQLWNAGKEKDGRYWAAVVKLGPQSDKFTATGYPLLFRAVITGGAIREAMSTLTVDFE